ncbi:MAG: hypothetical protein ABIF40_03105 [archaeon]
MKIIPYEKKYRKQLRKLCNDTAFNGLGVNVLFTDKELFADLITKYYTDVEPESTFIAVDKGKLVGYITGCIKPKEHNRYWIKVLLTNVPKVIYRYIFKYGKKNRKFINLFFQQFSNGYPKEVKNVSHFHRNVKEGYRGKGVGTKLVKVFYKYVKKNTKNRRLVREFIAFGRWKFKYYQEKGYKIFDYKQIKLFPGKDTYFATAFIKDFTKEKFHKKRCSQFRANFRTK